MSWCHCDLVYIFGAKLKPCHWPRYNVHDWKEDFTNKVLQAIKSNVLSPPTLIIMSNIFFITEYASGTSHFVKEIKGTSPGTVMATSKEAALVPGTADMCQIYTAAVERVLIHAIFQLIYLACTEKLFSRVRKFEAWLRWFLPFPYSSLSLCYRTAEKSW